jgi:excinuclease ABC subunit A
MSRGRSIRVEGARQNNLKGVTVTVSVGAVTAVTGVAGAGKSSIHRSLLPQPATPAGVSGARKAR